MGIRHKNPILVIEETDYSYVSRDTVKYHDLERNVTKDRAKNSIIYLVLLTPLWVNLCILHRDTYAGAQGGPHNICQKGILIISS